jgi:hypothetical protein
MDIRFNVVGRIISGDNLGDYIKVIDDVEKSGGFFILTSAEPSMLHGFDDWVRDNAALQQYFNESKWIIEWI